MKTLELRPEGPEYTVPTKEGTITVKESPWRELVEMTANAPVMNARTGEQMPFTPDIMRKRLKLLKAVEDLPEDATELELEGDEEETLVAALPGVPWGRFSQWTLDYCDAVTALSSQNGKKTD